MAETVRLRFTPEGSDYSRVMRAHSARTRTVWLSLVGMIVILLAFLWTTTYEQQGCLALWLVLILAPLFTGLVVFVLQPYRTKRHVSKTEQLRRETSMEFGDSQIVITTGEAETKMGWDTFRQVIETRTDYLLCYATYKHMVHFVPKRAFETPEHELAFRRLVLRKLPAGRWM